jgi:hypothetical protein
MWREPAKEAVELGHLTVADVLGAPRVLMQRYGGLLGELDPGAWAAAAAHCFIIEVVRFSMSLLLLKDRSTCLW